MHHDILRDTQHGHTSNTYSGKGPLMIECATKEGKGGQKLLNAAIVLGVLLSELSLLVRLGSGASYAPASGPLLRYDYHALLYALCWGGTRARLYIVCFMTKQMIAQCVRSRFASQKLVFTVLSFYSQLLLNMLVPSMLPAICSSPHCLDQI